MIRSNDSLSLRRISHRLVMTSDGDLPEILLALLPRVLQRMQQIELKINARMSMEPSSHQRRLEAGEIDITEETSIHIVCKEIATHALERVRGLEATMPIPWISEVSSFLSSACILDAWVIANSEQTSPCSSICDSRTLALDFLQEAILRLYKLSDFNNEIISRILTATLQAVDWFHASSSISIQHMEGLFKASWIVLDAIAVGNQFPPLFAFNYYLGEAKFKSKCCLGPVPLISPSQILQDAAAKFGVGMLHLFLDVILFHPDLSNTADYNFERWMQQRSILTQHSLRTSLQQRRTNTSIISPLNPHPPSSSEDSGGLSETSNMSYRLQYRANSDKITSSEEILKETRNIKLSCYRFASLLFNDAENVASVQRALLLAVVAQSDLYLCTEVKAQFRSLLSRVQGLKRLRKFKSKGDSGNDPMVGLLSSLFILILSKEKVHQLRQNMHLDSGYEMDWEAILGPISLLQFHNLSLASVSSVLEFTLEQLSVSPWWQDMHIDQEEENKNIEFLLHLLFEVAEEAVGLTHNHSLTGEEQISPLLWKRFLKTDEAKRCALGAGILRNLSRKLTDNPKYKKKFHNYFNFLCRIIELITSMYCMLFSFENEHPTPPSRMPDVAFDSAYMIEVILESQRLSAPARFRGECYHAIGNFMIQCGDYVPTLKDPTFFKLPGNLLICLMAEEDDILRETIAMSLHNALQAYEVRLAQEPPCVTYRDSSLYLSDILPILLAASCSYNSVVRLLAIRCLSGIVRFFDPLISYHILTLFVEENSLEVHKASLEAISKLEQSAVISIFPLFNGMKDTLNCIPTETLGIPHSCLNFGPCSSCGEPSHYPAMCTDTSKWNALYGASSLEKGLLDAPKRCAGCNATITKYQGCSHLKCLKCNINTCSLCLKCIAPYSTHVCGDYERNQAEEFRILCLHMYHVYSSAEKFARDQLHEVHNGSNVQWPPYLILRVNNPLIEQSIYALIACRKFLKHLSVRLYFNHEDINGQNGDSGEHPANRIRALRTILQVFTERLGKLTELENEEETMSYGISGIPLFLRSLKVYALIALEVMHQLAVLIEGS